MAAPDAPLDYSAQGEKALIDRGLPYLHLVMRSAHWRVYAVAHPTPIASGVATLTRLGPDSLTLRARRPGTVRLHVRFTPYWELSRGLGVRGPGRPLDPADAAPRRSGRARHALLTGPDRRRPRRAAHSPSMPN